MASPFNVFRKQQKVFMAFFGVLLMIAFLLLGRNYSGGSGAGSLRDKPVVSWKYGQLTRGQLSERLTMRKVVNKFLIDAYQLAATKVYTRQTVSDTAMPQRIGFPFPEDERSVVMSLMMGKKAELSGLVVSDKAVEDYLKAVTGNLVTNAEFDQLVRSMSGQQVHITARQLSEALAQELLAYNYTVLVDQVLNPADDPAGLRWEYFNRLNKEMTI